MGKRKYGQSSQYFGVKIVDMATEIDYLYGIPIFITNHITKQVRCRTHKKRRIDKKWLKKYGYKEVQDDSKMYMFDGKLLMSQKCFDKLKNTVRKEQIFK